MLLLGFWCLLQLSGCAGLRGGGQAGPEKEMVKAQEPCQALKPALELYLPSVPGPAEARALEEKLYPHCGDYARKAGGGIFEVSYGRLGRDLERWGVLARAGAVGSPKIALWIQGAQPGAREALRLALLERGYQAVDLQDPDGSARASSREGAETLARRAGARWLVAGKSESVRKDGLEGYFSWEAGLRLEVRSLEPSVPLKEWTESASAVDLTAEGAQEKAAANAGELAGGKLAALLAEQVPERRDMAVVVQGPASLDKIRRFLEALRALPRVASARFESRDAGQARIMVLSGGASVDELAAAILELRQFHWSVRSLDSDYRILELSPEDY